MKRIQKFYLSLFICTFFVLVNSYSQSAELSVAVKTENVSGSFKKDGRVEITILEGNPKYKYLLYDELPNTDNFPILETDWIDNTIQLFEGLKKGTYFILVYDEADKAELEKIEITIQPKK